MFSFDVDAPARIILPADLNRAKTAALSACMELIDRLQGPTSCLLPLVNSHSIASFTRISEANRTLDDFS